MEKKSIGAFLAVLRKANGFTQQEVADRLSVSNRTVSSWECDSALPDILLLPALAELYGVTADEILAGERKQSAEKMQTRELSEKAEQSLLKNKFARFSTRTCILFGAFAAGFLLLFLGWYLYADHFSSDGEESGALFALIVVGAIMILLSGACLIALWRGAAYGAEDETGGRFRLRLRRRMALYAFLAAGFSLVFTVAAAVPVLRTLLSYGQEIGGAAGELSVWLRNLAIERFGPLLCTFSALMLVFAACGLVLLLYRRARRV